MISKRLLVLHLVLFSVLLLWARTAGSQSAQTQLPSGSRCVFRVPAEWGDYISSDRYGIAFKDEQGTLRFVTQFPCGFDGPPNVAIEIRRR